MDIEKAVSFVSNTASDYLAAVISTFTKPVSHFEPIYEVTGSATGASDQVEISPRFHPRLLVYTFLNLTAGLLLRSLTVSKEPVYGLFLGLEIFVVFIWWVIFATLVHVLCVFAKGTGTYVATMSVALQLMSTMYLASAFVTLLLCSVLRRMDERVFTDYSMQYVSWTSAVSAGITLLFFAIYLTPHLKRLHAFSTRRALFVTLVWVVLVALLFVLISLADAPVGKRSLRK